MKRISFFGVLQNIVLSISAFMLMLAVSYALVSVTFYSHKNPQILYDETIPSLNAEETEEFHGYFKDMTLVLIVKFRIEKEDLYLLNYAYSYYDLYRMPVSLAADNAGQIRYVTVSDCGIGTID